mgnify:CR=1 FL=1
MCIRVIFDPDSEQYITTTTQPIPLDLAPSTPDPGLATAILPDLDTPVEEMESTLGLINPIRDFLLYTSDAADEPPPVELARPAILHNKTDYMSTLSNRSMT